MRISPILTNVSNIVFGAFMEGPLPENMEYSIQDLLNNFATARCFYAQPTGKGVKNWVPQTISTTQMSPAPAWTTVMGYRGKRVLPKVSLPTYSKELGPILASGNSFAINQLDTLFAVILNHRISSSSSATSMRQPLVTNSCLPTPSVKNADGFWTIAEYDFGAEIVLSGVSGITESFSTSYGNVLNTAGNVWLQVLVGRTWTDALNVTSTLGNNTTKSEKYTQLAATVKGTKFRLVAKDATVPSYLGYGIGLFELHFYGEYTAGKDPRTFTSIGHMVAFEVADGTSSYAGPAFSNKSQGSYGRYFAHVGLSITNDLTKASQFDMFLADTNVYVAQEQTVPALYTENKVISMEKV